MDQTLSHPRHSHDDGRARRAQVPRRRHAEWSPPPDRPDPVAVLKRQERHRIASLLPLRHERMAASPFAFLRGATAIMAGDLAHTPASGLRVQSSGDCHLANFGSYASPEGTPLFDLNDFDETLPAPFEWDLKRLAASFAVAARDAGQSDGHAAHLARRMARSYRTHMHRLAALPPLDAWSTRVDLAPAIAAIDGHKLRDKVERRLARALDRAGHQFGLVDMKAPGGPRLVDTPPTMRHLDAEGTTQLRDAFVGYAARLPEDRRVLLARYRLVDVALKVVGVGSVGTFCGVGLYVSEDGAPLLLQVKEAQQSVLAGAAGVSTYANQGERVVTGQRILQAASDVFLGFPPDPVDGRFFYVRRLKDSRLADIGDMIQEALPFYAGLCGHTLARAHARAGAAAGIAGYLGTGDVFDQAIGDFALAYADQTRRDWRRFTTALAAGEMDALSTL